MMKCTGLRCPMQAGTVDPATCEAADTCKFATRPQTNADRIRAMSDEELARWAWAVQSGIFCADIYTTDEWLDWLRQEAAEPTKDRPAPICQTCGNFETCPWRHEGIFSGPKDKARRVVACSDYKTE